MRLNLRCRTFAFLLLVSLPLLCAQELKAGANDDPFESVQKASDFCRGKKQSEISREIASTANNLSPQDAQQLAYIAELMKQSGDARASLYYDRAIQAENNEPAYELFYADYMRIFRGPPQEPLFPQAEEHYIQALKKLVSRANQAHPVWDAETKSRAERGLIALYERDGFGFVSRRTELKSAKEFLKTPSVFLASINGVAESTTDLDREADVRDYTSEALFAQSPSRLGTPLTEDQLRGLIRTKRPLEILDRIRFRYENWPVVDVFYTHRQTDEAAVTSFFVPDKFNDLRFNEYGVRVEKPFTIGRSFDISLSGVFKRTQRVGLIEFFPASAEFISHYETRAAISRFFGPDKASLEFVHAYQSIHTDVPNHPDRARRFIGGTLTYQLLRPIGRLHSSSYGRHFEIGSWDFFGGFLVDNESFPNVDPSMSAIVRRRDYFAGISLKGLGPFDLTIQPTWFTSSVSNDQSQYNSQYRTNLTLVWRVIDEENTPGLPCTQRPLNIAFWHIVFPFKQDTGLSGLTAFENYKLGVESDWKIFTVAGRTSFLVSARYDFQRFDKLNENKNIVTMNVSMGF